MFWLLTGIYKEKAYPFQISFGKYQLELLLGINIKNITFSLSNVLHTALVTRDFTFHCWSYLPTARGWSLLTLSICKSKLLGVHTVLVTWNEPSSCLKPVLHTSRTLHLASSLLLREEKEMSSVSKDSFLERWIGRIHWGTWENSW